MTYSSEVLADSPYLWWRLGEASGTTAADSSGNGRNGTYAGSPTLGATSLLGGDPANTAASFDGVDDRLTRADSVDMLAFTAEVWVKRASAPVNEGIVFARDADGSPGRIFWISILGAGRPSFVLWNAAASSFTQVNGPSSICDGNPHHVVGTYDPATGTMTLYVDGVSVATGTRTAPASWSADVAFSVGASSNAAVTSKLAATIDEVAFYLSTLSGTRVAAHYTAGSSVAAETVTPDLLASAAVVREPELEAGTTAVSPSPILSAASVRPVGLLTSITVTPGLLGGGTVLSAPALQPMDEVGIPAAGAGWLRDNTGIGSWLPDVAPPTAAIFPQNRVVAQAFTAPVVDGTHVLVEPTYAYETAHRDRIIVGGVDITYWRGIPTPTPEWQYIQPLGWAAGTLRIPQAVMPFEVPGEGALSWCPEGAAVVVQRVDPAMDAVVATDYRGIVVTYDIQGGELVLELGGHGAGRANLLDRQAQLIQRRRPAGRMTAWAVRYMGLQHDPALGADTGITLIDWGGGGLADYVNEVVAKMATVDGDQWTVMPDDSGVYRTFLKDTTTIHGSIYADDARVRLDLRRDISEEPNRIFASGVTPEGMVVKFGAYPGLIQGEAAPYPFNDNRTFGPGTVDADTDTGDGITVMGNQLFTAGYIRQRAGDPGYNLYDADYVQGIKDLQDDAGLTQSGNMNPNTWAALWNLQDTGYDLRNIYILPAAERPEVKGWLRSSNGAIIARNPAYNPAVLPRERTIAMGAGFTRDQIRRWAAQELQGSDEQSWRGTITITTGAVVAGDHTPGSPIAAIVRARDIRPGQNYRLPLFAGGIVVHVAAVSVRDQGQTVELVVSTKPGDTIPVWEAIQRDRDSRNTVHRSFFAQRKAASLERENTFDEVGGVISPVKLNPGGWTVFPVVAKQAGTIQKIRLRLTDQREFACAVFGRRISPARLRGVTNAPLTAAGSKRWNASFDQLDEDHVVLYVAGDSDDPCGYSPGRKSEDDPITGRHVDDASFPFITFANDTDRGSVLWVAVWVTAGSGVSVRGGRIMWPSAEDY